MPASLKERLDRAAKFNGGYALAEMLAACFLDMDWHMLPATQVPQQVDTFEDSSLKTHGLEIREVPPRYRTRYFQHIWTLAYGRLLLVSLERGARCRCLCLVQGERGDDAADVE
jgi:peptidyl-dipeptidase Dcp